VKLLFVADPIETFKPQKDSTLAMMAAAQKAGHQIFHGKVSGLNWRGNTVRMVCHEIKVDRTQRPWFELISEADTPLKNFDAVLMRADPPFDDEFLANTWLLSQAEREGANVFNSPTGLREHSEKLSIAEFPELTAPTMVTRSIEAIREFHREHQDIIVKPLDGMGGMGIFRVGPDGVNLGSIVETLGQNGRRALMAQKYLPEITQGDKRLLMIRGKPVPYVLARVPQAGDIRGNLAAGGKGEARPLTDAEKKIAQTLGEKLYARGLFLVGLDIIGDRLTEINVTSPTCFVEITEQTGYDVAEHWLKELEAEIFEKKLR
jgi:glutathione synthase